MRKVTDPGVEATKEVSAEERELLAD